MNRHLLLLIIMTFLINGIGCERCKLAISSQNFYEESYVLNTTKGKIRLICFPCKAPLHSDNFKDLVENKYYKGLSFHRVIPNFVIQAGRKEPVDNSKDLIKPEFSAINFRYSLAMARKDDKVNPQKLSDPFEFYINLQTQPDLDSNYSVFGKVVEGFSVVDSINMNYASGTVKIIDCYIEKWFNEEKYQVFVKKQKKK